MRSHAGPFLRSFVLVPKLHRTPVLWLALSPTELIEKLAALVPHAVIAARSRGINQMWQIHRPQSSGEPPFVSCLDASPTRSKRHTFPGRHTDSTR